MPSSSSIPRADPRAVRPPARRSPGSGQALAIELALGLGATLALAGPGCGASVSAIYEGDVRFEHCMTLDARPTASTSERRMCWIEWVRYYTYGQTQDRVEYARDRSSGTEGLGSDGPEPLGPLTAPEPTSAFAPPPMVAPAGSEADAGVEGRPAPTGASVKPPPSTPPPPPSAGPNVDPACQADCSEAREDCRSSCRGASCEKSCSGKYTRCLERCAEVRGRPPG